MGWDKKLNFNPEQAYRDIFEEYLDTASFLWQFRVNALNDPSYYEKDIFELEQRLKAQLDGLLYSINLSWSLCEDNFETADGGDVFTAAILAFNSKDEYKVNTVISTGLSNVDRTKGLVSAMGWLASEIIEPWILKLLKSNVLDQNYLAISACSVRRRNPGQYLHLFLNREDCREHEPLYSRSLRLVGEIKRNDLSKELISAQSSDIDNIKFWANRSLILLGDNTSVNNLKQFCITNNVNQLIAIDIAFRALSLTQAQKWISEMIKDEKQFRAVIKSIGIIGDPQAVNWLIKLMQQDKYSRLAGESFTNITGINLFADKLTSDLDEQWENSPNDNPNDNNVGMDEDEELPYPDVDKINVKWNQEKINFTNGHRYFMGADLNETNLLFNINNGTQRQRHSAALTLSLINKKQTLLNISQCTFR